MCRLGVFYRRKSKREVSDTRTLQCSSNKNRRRAFLVCQTDKKTTFELVFDVIHARLNMNVRSASAFDRFAYVTVTTTAVVIVVTCRPCRIVRYA